MNNHRHLDLSGSEPMLSGTRISVLDVYHISTQLDDEAAEQTLLDEWGLNQKQVEAALNYYQDNEDEMRNIQQKKSEIAQT